MSKWTPGPWTIESRTSPRAGAGDCHVIRDREQRAIGTVYQGREEDEGNAARIVSCVNACEGIEDPAAVPALLTIATALRERAKDWAAPKVGQPACHCGEADLCDACIGNLILSALARASSDPAAELNGGLVRALRAIARASSAPAAAPVKDDAADLLEAVKATVAKMSDKSPCTDRSMKLTLDAAIARAEGRKDGGQ